MKVKVVPAAQLGIDKDEVFMVSDDGVSLPTIFAKAGVFKDGDITVDEAMKLVEKSEAALDEELNAKLKTEEAERNKAAKAEAAKSSKKASSKEG